MLSSDRDSFASFSNAYTSNNWFNLIALINASNGLPQWQSRYKESTCNAGDTGDGGLIPASGRSPEGGSGNPLQYSCLENPWTEESGRLRSIALQTDKNEAT